MTGKRIGYIRVSTQDQNPDRQLEGMTLDKRFIEYSSAKSTNRPQLKLLLDFIREDDIVMVHSMDRLARNLKDLRTLVDEMVSKGAQVQFLKENLTFNGSDSAMARLLLSVMGAFAEFEHAFIKERQMEGILIAQAKGRYKGRQRKLNDKMISILKEELTTCKNKKKIAAELGISRPTLYRYMGQMDIKKPLDLLSEIPTEIT